jgi:hypothetical protein
MPTITYYVVLPFTKSEDGLLAEQAVEAPSADGYRFARLVVDGISGTVNLTRLPCAPLGASAAFCAELDSPRFLPAAAYPLLTRCLPRRRVAPRLKQNVAVKPLIYRGAG